MEDYNADVHDVDRQVLHELDRAYRGLIWAQSYEDLWEVQDSEAEPKDDTDNDGNFPFRGAGKSRLASASGLEPICGDRG